MTTTPEPGRLSSDWPRPCGRSGPGCARFHTRTFQSRTLSPAAIRPGLVKRRGGRFRLPLAPERASRRAPSLPEKMRLTDVCNRLTTRAPCEPFDSRLRLRRPRGLLRAPPAARAAGFHLGGASLDGDPPASALDAHRFATPAEPASKRGSYPELGANEIPLGPGGCRDRRPLRRYPSATVFSTASRVGDVASDAPVAPDDLRPGFRPADTRRTPGPLSHPSRQRGVIPQAGTPSIDACSLCPLAQTSRGTRHRFHDFAVAIRLPAPVRPSAWEGLDPPPSGVGPGAARRLLQSTWSASTTDRTA